MNHNLKSRLEKLEATREAVAVIEVLPGEIHEDAWRRHLAERPQDEAARIKVFLSYPPREAWTRPYHTG
jgi:hypothetical protein